MQLERNNPAPLYEQLKKIIEQKIEQGDLEADDQIPSERELCEQYGVSRITVRQAINLAVNEGLLYRTHGRGTFVARPKIEQGLKNIHTFQQTLAAQGILASTKLLEAKFVPSDLFMSRLLETSMAEQVATLHLLGYGDEFPFVYYESYFSQQVGQTMFHEAKQAIEKNIPFSTLDLYSKRMGINPTHVEQTFESITSDLKISELLQIEPKSPILLVTSIVYENQKIARQRLCRPR